MKVNVWIILFMLVYLMVCVVFGIEKYQISMDSVMVEKISWIIQLDVIFYKGENYGEVISCVLFVFFGIFYQVDMFIGGFGIFESFCSEF